MLPVNTHNILQTYLKNRKFRVKYNEYVTRDYDIMSGVWSNSNDTAILSSHCNHVIASSELNSHLKRMEIWFNNRRIKINELKSKHITFILRKGDYPLVFLNNIKLLDRRLTWRNHIEAKSCLWTEVRTIAEPPETN